MTQALETKLDWLSMDILRRLTLLLPHFERVTQPTQLVTVVATQTALTQGDFQLAAIARQLATEIKATGLTRCAELPLDLSSKIEQHRSMDLESNLSVRAERFDNLVKFCVALA